MYTSIVRVSVRRHAFNDVVVLNVHRSRGMFYSNGAVGSSSNGNFGGGGGGGRGGDTAAAAFSSSSRRAHPARRRRYSRDNHEGRDSDDSESESECEQPERTPTPAGGSGGGSHHGYTYTWVHPMVRGAPPVGRLAHSSAVVRLLDDGDGASGCGSGQQAFMMVFGGVGTGQVFNDVSALRYDLYIQSTVSLRWQQCLFAVFESGCGWTPALPRPPPPAPSSRSGALPVVLRIHLSTGNKW